MSKTTSRTSNLRAKIRIFIILTIVGGVAILGALLSLFLFEIEDTIYADGTIIPEHTFELVGHVDAHVKKFNFRTGDDVKEGDVIAELDARAYEADALAAESAVRELAAELEVKKAELRILEREPLPKELWYSHTNLKECQEKVERARDRLERSKKLQLVSAISKIEFERAELEAIQREAELARAKENARRVDEGLGQQYLDKAKRDMELVAAKMEGKKAELAYLKKRIEECKLVAPATGRIVELDCKNTWYVARGKIAARVASGNRSRAIARIDARVVRKIKPGQAVRVTSDVYNKLQYGNFSGVVKWIGDVPIPQLTPNSQIQYPAEVELDPEGYSLKYGSGVELAIITGKQPAIYALLNMSDEDFDARRKRENQRLRMTVGKQHQNLESTTALHSGDSRDTK